MEVADVMPRMCSSERMLIDRSDHCASKEEGGVVGGEREGEGWGGSDKVSMESDDTKWVETTQKEPPNVGVGVEGKSEREVIGGGWGGW